MNLILPWSHQPLIIRNLSITGELGERKWDLASTLWYSLPQEIADKAASQVLWDINKSGWESNVLKMFRRSRKVVKLYPVEGPLFGLILDVYHRIHRQLSSLWLFRIEVPSFKVRDVMVNSLNVRVLDLDPDSIGLACSIDNPADIFLAANNKYVPWSLLSDLVEDDHLIFEITVKISWYLSNQSSLSFGTTHSMIPQIYPPNIKLAHVGEDGTAELVITDVAGDIIFFIMNNLVHQMKWVSGLIGKHEADIVEVLQQIEVDENLFDFMFRRLELGLLSEVVKKRRFSFSPAIINKLIAAKDKGSLSDRLWSALIEGWYVKKRKSG